MNIIYGCHIANSILKKSSEDKIHITPLKLNCLLYLLYSEYLYLTGESLFNETFIKTTKGPIVPSVYYKFISYENYVINNYIKDAKGKVIYVKDGIFDECLIHIWEKYKNKSDYDILSYIEDGTEYSKKNNEEQLSDIDILNDILTRKEKELENARSYIKKMILPKNIKTNK